MPFCLSQNSKSQFPYGHYLSTVNDFKEKIRLSTALSQDERREIILNTMPRYLWRASASNDNNLMLEFLFDATDIEQGNYFLRAIEYDKTFSRLIKLILKDEKMVGEILDKLRAEGRDVCTTKRLLDWYRPSAPPV